MAIGKLQKVSLREAFPHEAHSFTKWLAENIDALSDGIGLKLNILEREKAVGSFNVDLFCEDQNGNYVIVENQLEKTDHDHLGKVLTYLVNLDAKTAIWVTSEARPEHQRAIDWLNESTSADYSFYLVQIGAVRIGDSPYAPLFTVLASPDEQIREIGETKKDLAERHYQRLEFWKGLLEKSKTRTRLFSGNSPSTTNYLGTATGKSGFRYGYGIRMNNASAYLAIDLGRGAEEATRLLFEKLYSEKEAIEKEFGSDLNWQNRDDERTKFVTCMIQGLGGLLSPDNWNDIQNTMIDAMIQLDKVFKPRIAKL